jgi:hypothetical protein
MALKITNNATSVLAAGISSTDTALSVSAGTGSKFPILAAGDWFPLTVVDAGGGYEIMRVTARSGDVLTVSRSQEGTAAQSFAPGCRADLRVTAAALMSFVEAATALLAEHNLSDLNNAATARTNLGLGTAATHAVGDFATAAQGAKADSAVQSGSIGTAAAKDVGTASGQIPLNSNLGAAAKSNNYSDLSGKPTLGSAAAYTAGAAANNVLLIGSDGKLPAIDGSNVFNIGVVPTSELMPVGWSGLLSYPLMGGATPPGSVVAGSNLKVWLPEGYGAPMGGIAQPQAGSWKLLLDAGTSGSSAWVLGYITGLYVRIA